ncbi:MAG: hypothetical protein PHF00_05395, partial [Elusimicrobia bacterium]|nr:hypothetical protein [Elusimicrobiota bacterium]
AAVLFDLHEPGLEAAQDIVEEWREFLRDGFEYAAVEVPADGPWLGPLYDLLSTNGFFAAGFVPYRCSGRLGFRFQALGPTQVAFDKIQIATEHGKKLLRAVRKDCEDNCRL